MEKRRSGGARSEAGGCRSEAAGGWDEEERCRRSGGCERVEWVGLPELSEPGEEPKTESASAVATELCRAEVRVEEVLDLWRRVCSGVDGAVAAPP